MLIRSQNKGCLIPYESILYLDIVNDGKYHVRANTIIERISLGTYDTWDACKEVLENIYYCYGNKCICYQMPEVIEDE